MNEQNIREIILDKLHIFVYDNTYYIYLCILAGDGGDRLVSPDPTISICRVCQSVSVSLLRFAITLLDQYLVGHLIFSSLIHP